MRLGVRAGSVWAESVTVALVALDKGPRDKMDVGRGVRAGSGPHRTEVGRRGWAGPPSLTVPAPADEHMTGPGWYPADDAHPPGWTEAAPVRASYPLVPVPPMRPAAQG